MRSPELSASKNQDEKDRRESPVENLALRNGLSVIILKNAESEAVLKANNNSICEILYNSAGFAPKCAEFCGRAFEDAMQAGEAVEVKCHAGLHYHAVPLKSAEQTPLVAIVGRTFLKSEEYKNAAARTMSGDWQDFPPTELFKNVHLASSESEIERMTKQLEKLVKKEREYFSKLGATDEPAEENKPVTENKLPSPETEQTTEISKMVEDFHKKSRTEMTIGESLVEDNIEEAEESAAWRAVFGSLLDMEYKNAYLAVLHFLASRYSFANLAWLENVSDRLETVLAYGDFLGQPIEIGLSADDPRLLEAVENETSLELRERQTENPNFKGKTINLFPLAVGGKVISALLIGDQLTSQKIKRRIEHFVQSVSGDLEILRLREKVERQSRTAEAIQRLNETLKDINGENFWNSAAQISAELMRAERGSLLILDEETEELTVKAAVGSRADIIKQENSEDVGKRIAYRVLQSGKPLIVKNLKKEGINPAPPDWKYKSDSFISYPIVIGGRKIGVLNVTDTIDGENYDESDLELLDTLSPQLAVAIDRAALKLKTIELKQISITDPLTGLLNRRYLEERLAEEINRSNRHGYQTSFMMIDVDHFKSYNDEFSHPEGDKALQIVGQCLKSTLRGADVAARYGGEEFSILLPQTSINEAYTIAERLREKIAAIEFPHRQVTVSIGISSCIAEMCSAKELIAAADKSLYQAKKKGRNNVQISRTAGFSGGINSK